MLLIDTDIDNAEIYPPEEMCARLTQFPIKIYDKRESEAPRPQAGASRKGNYAYIAPLIPAFKAGLAGCAPGQVVKSYSKLCSEGTFSRKNASITEPIGLTYRATQTTPTVFAPLHAI